MQVTAKQTLQKPSRLAAVRRLYVYIVALVSLVAGLASVNDLLDVLSRQWLAGNGDLLLHAAFVRTAVARSSGIMLVATPLFLIHWWLAQRRRHESDERDSVLRKLFLYGATGVSLGFFLTTTYFLIRDMAALAFGVLPDNVDLLPSNWLHWTLMAAIGAALAAHWRLVLEHDGDLGREERGGRIVRQLFATIVGLVALAIALWGARTLVEVGVQVSIDRALGATYVDWWRFPLGRGVSQLLVGLWLARTNWLQWGEVVTMRPDEGRSVLRRVYLYVGVVIGAVATLSPAALLLREGLLILFGAGGGALNELLNRMVDPLSFLPAGAAIWYWHATTVQREAAAYGESEQSHTARRVYAYLVAATGLALLWIGTAELLNALIDALLVGSLWDEPLATGLSLLAVGAPIWTHFWRQVQSAAGQKNAVGVVERNSWPRKLYLYGVALAGALVILFTLAQVIYRLLLMALGDPDIDFFSPQTAHLIAASLVAALFWTVHLLAIRSDGRREQLGEATPQAGTAGDISQRRADLQARIAALEEELAVLRANLVALQETSDEP
ncbi:MAG: hypothetical protein H3C34_19255 [Caldilineaceae bacterium]|nr:hypothetical protein [Caldilineaceae bacterium]